MGQPTARERFAAVWPHLRAGLLAFHVVAVVLVSVPSPQGGLNRSAWRDPTVQEEFAAWNRRLAAVGVQMTDAELEELVWTGALAYQDVHATLMAPFQPYYRWAGTWQSWKMFVAPHRYPARLQIEIQRADGSWEMLYVARSDRYDWHRRQLDHDRMRALVFRFGWRHYRRQYTRFAKWVAATVAREQPDARKVQLRFYKYRTASPEEVRTGTEPRGELQGALVFELEDFRCEPAPACWQHPAVRPRHDRGAPR